FPARVSAIALLACARMQRQGTEAAAFRHTRQFDADNLVVVPSGAKFYGEGNLYRAAHRVENLPDQRQIAQETRAAIALHDFLCRAPKVQVDQVEAEVLHQARGVGQHARTAPKELGRDRVLVFIKMQVASPDAL